MGSLLLFSGSAELRAVVCTCTVVSAFLVHAECIPCSGTEDLFGGYVVHGNGDAEHGAHGDEVSTDVAVADRAVVCAPVVHYIVCGLEGRTFLAVAARSEPCAGPCIVGSLPESIGNFVGEANSPAFSDLKNRAETLNEIETDHGAGHFSLGYETGRISAATEVAEVCEVPCGVVKDSLQLLHPVTSEHLYF